MGGVNLPITSPLWIAQRIAENLDLTSEAQSNQQVEQIEKETIKSATAKINKTAEKELEGVSQMHKLHHQLHKNLIGGTSGITMNDTRGADNGSQTVSRNEERGLSMTDTVRGQGYMVRSTKEISTPKRNEDEIAVDDRRHVRIEGNELIVTD